MLRQVVRHAVGVSAVAAMLMAAPVQAQDARVEIGASAGWDFSDGVNFDGVVAGNGQIYNGIEPKDSFAYSLNLGYYATEQVEVGFLFSQQKSKLNILGTTDVEIGDMSVDNYHGYVAYNAGDSDATVRPYFLFGLGWTHYGSVPFTVGSVSRDTQGNSQFSTTWGVGVKLFPSPKAGLRLGARWTPTYIKSDAAGWWCDPYWGCYVVGDAQYSNQFELSGGLILRF
jgi:outer membrane protein with beta-barrel domain